MGWSETTGIRKGDKVDEEGKNTGNIRCFGYALWYGGGVPFALSDAVAALDSYDS